MIRTPRIKVGTDSPSYVEIEQKQGYGIPSTPPVAINLADAAGVTRMWEPWPCAHLSTPALVDEIFRARCRLYVLINEIPIIQERFPEAKPSNAYTHAAHKLYLELSDRWTATGARMGISNNPSSQLLSLQSVSQIP